MYFAIMGTSDRDERMRGLKVFAKDLNLRSADISMTDFIESHEEQIIGVFAKKGKATLMLDDDVNKVEFTI